MKVVQSAITYRALAYHTLADQGKKTLKGIAKGLLTAQSNCLRVVASAYQATPVRSLETETWVPPLDIYLNKRVVDFKARLERTGKGALLQAVHDKVANTTRHRRTRRGATRPSPAISLVEGSSEARAAWATRWLQGLTADEALERDWRERWQGGLDEAMARRPGRDMEPADQPEFTREALTRHTRLRKHESSVLTQMRTGKIGLRAFLYACRVLEVESPLC